MRKISIWQTQWKHCWGIRSSANDSFPAVAYRLKSGKKVREKKVTHTHESDWVLHLVALWLGVDSASSLFSRHVQDVLWHRKPYLKVDGRARSSPVRGGSLLLSQRVRVHIVGPTQHIWGFFSPLLLQPAPPEQLMLSSKWTHWPELHRQNIPFCRPPQPRFELHNLPSFLHRQPAVSSLGWGFRRLLLMNSLTLDRCASLRVFGQVVQNTSHYISEPSSFMTLCSGRSSPLPFNFGRSVLSPLRVFISVLCVYVECCGGGHLALLTAGSCFSIRRGIYGKSPRCFVFCALLTLLLTAEFKVRIILSGFHWPCKTLSFLSGASTSFLCLMT